MQSIQRKPPRHRLAHGCFKLQPAPGSDSRPTRGRPATARPCSHPPVPPCSRCSQCGPRPVRNWRRGRRRSARSGPQACCTPGRAVGQLCRGRCACPPAQPRRSGDAPPPDPQGRRASPSASIDLGGGTCPQPSAGRPASLQCGCAGNRQHRARRRRSRGLAQIGHEAGQVGRPGRLDRALSEGAHRWHPPQPARRPPPSLLASRPAADCLPPAPAKPARIELFGADDDTTERTRTTLVIGGGGLPALPVLSVRAWLDFCLEG